jgi:hypothetical protein
MENAVYLNIYDISGANKFLHCLGIGVYHTTININDQEYKFGAHN